MVKQGEGRVEIDGAVGYNGETQDDTSAAMITMPASAVRVLSGTHLPLVRPGTPGGPSRSSKATSRCTAQSLQLPSEWWVISRTNASQCRTSFKTAMTNVELTTQASFGTFCARPVILVYVHARQFGSDLGKCAAYERHQKRTTELSSSSKLDPDTCPTGFGSLPPLMALARSDVTFLISSCERRISINKAAGNEEPTSPLRYP